MIEGKIINCHTDRRVFSDQNRNKARATNTSTNSIETILLQNVDVRCQFGDCGHIGNKRVLNLSLGERRHR